MSPMEISYTIFDLLFYLLLYAFLGWCVEVFCAAVKSGRFVNRGFLNLPLNMPCGIAAALLGTPKVIILDEPTAALDPIAEYEIYSKFNEIVENKTAIYISHRLSSCRFCQNIIVFDNGQIVQSGSHEELVTDEKGKYYELWHAQAQYYTE